jgi:hypothetical protein
MAVTTTFYNDFKEKLLNGGGIDLDTNDIYVALCTSSYVPSKDNHDFFDDITSEVSATGYTAGGQEITCTVTQDNTNDRSVVTVGASTTWTTSTITARYAIIYKSTGNPATSNLICYIDFGENKVSDGDNFIIDWDDTDGLINLT